MHRQGSHAHQSTQIIAIKKIEWCVDMLNKNTFLGVFTARKSMTCIIILLTLLTISAFRVTAHPTPLRQPPAAARQILIPGIPSVPDTAAAAQVVRYHDSTEVTFFNQRGVVIETIVLDVPNPGIRVPGDALTYTTFDENGNTVRREATIARIIDRDGNVARSSHTEWYGDQNVIRRINGAFVLNIPLRQ